MEKNKIIKNLTLAEILSKMNLNCQQSLWIILKVRTLTAFIIFIVNDCILVWIVSTVG